jgi:hypothetical protein
LFNTKQVFPEPGVLIWEFQSSAYPIFQSAGMKHLLACSLCTGVEINIFPGLHGLFSLVRLNRHTAFVGIAKNPPSANSIITKRVLRMAGGQVPATFVM